MILIVTIFNYWPLFNTMFSDDYGDEGGGVEDDEAAGQAMVVGGRRDRHAKRTEAYHLVLSRC